MIVTITDKFRDLFKRQKYEEFIFLILRRSRYLFDGNLFIKIEEQSQGECDFLYDNKIKYESKLLISKKQGFLVGDRKNSIVNWLNAMLQERSEFGECIKKRDLSGLKHTCLYSIMKERIEDVREDENAILFLPFPIVEDSIHNTFLQFATDFLQACYDTLEEDGLIGDRKVYFIYPSMENGYFVLRDSNYHREYISVPELDDIIVYETL